MRDCKQDHKHELRREEEQPRLDDHARRLEARARATRDARNVLLAAEEPHAADDERRGGEVEDERHCKRGVAEGDDICGGLRGGGVDG